MDCYAAIYKGNYTFFGVIVMDISHMPWRHEEFGHALNDLIQEKHLTIEEVENLTTEKIQTIILAAPLILDKKITVEDAQNLSYKQAFILNWCHERIDNLIRENLVMWQDLLVMTRDERYSIIELQYCILDKRITVEDARALSLEQAKNLALPAVWKLIDNQIFSLEDAKNLNDDDHKLLAAPFLNDDQLFHIMHELSIMQKANLKP